jgi:glycosyltransferase involved in cell wall biosynthesis
MVPSPAGPAPRVAVVVPCHDDGELIAESLASIRESEPVEIAVVDDGSSEPRTLAALQALRSQGVNVVVQPNRGPGAARMAGVRATRAPFVFPLDADDLLEPGALAALADTLEADRQAAFAWGDYLLFGDYVGRYRAPSRFLPWSLTYVNQYPLCSLVRRSALLEAGGYADRGYEDWGLWLGFVERGWGGCYAGRVVYRRRLRDGGRIGLEDRRRHQELFQRLQEQHAQAFALRPQLARRERPPRWKRAVYPLLFGRRALLPHAVEAWLQRAMIRFGLRLSR